MKHNINQFSRLDLGKTIELFNELTTNPHGGKIADDCIVSSPRLEAGSNDAIALESCLIRIKKYSVDDLKILQGCGFNMSERVESGNSYRVVEMLIEDIEKDRTIRGYQLKHAFWLMRAYEGINKYEAQIYEAEKLNTLKRVCGFDK